MSIKLLIDTDTASDDAVALIMALRAPEVQVEAITVVMGNVPVEQGVRNALYTVELCRSEVPVFRGAERPLVREPETAQFFHGQDGLADIGYEPEGEAAPGDAVEVIVETIRANPGIVIVTLGPLTNLALAVDRAPEIVADVGRCVVMGGAACTVGNVTPAAEFNIWVDPDAARAVFRSGLPIEMVGWELCRGDANLGVEEMQLVRGFGTRFSDFALDCNRTAIEVNTKMFGEPGLSLPDPIAMAVALEPALCTRSSRHRVDVEAASDLTRGMTVVDALDVTQGERDHPAWYWTREREPDTTICWEIDVPGWKEALYRALR